MWSTHYKITYKNNRGKWDEAWERDFDEAIETACVISRQYKRRAFVFATDDPYSDGKYLGSADNGKWQIE